jgi:ferredoxin/flavodoxin---NADP+ reductase
MRRLSHPSEVAGEDDVEMLTFEDISVDGYHELVRIARDDAAGLLAVIAIHSTALGPAMGGVRRRTYTDFDDAVADALRLSAAMTLKSSAAGLPFGGGKSVIVDARAEAADAVLDSFAEAVERLDGRYIVAEDIGTTPRDMDRIAARTRWVAGRSAANGGNGDPSPSTASTVFGAMRAAAEDRWQSDELAGRVVGVLGVGKVGDALARLAARAGARLVLADTVLGRAERLADKLPDALALAPDELLGRPLDVLAPCATGCLLTPELADQLDVEIVCGAANNILRDDGIAERLAERGILYLPDFIANAGGIIHVGGGFLGWEAARIEACMTGAIVRAAEVLAEGRARGVTPLKVANELATARLHPTGGRGEPVGYTPEAGVASAGPVRVAIVGSGPAGLYAAEQLLDADNLDVSVDVFERLPTPWGLVRAGVAPDHPRIKAVTRRYERTAARASFRLFGHVEVGRDLSTEELKRHYHAVIYAFGASGDRRLGVPGETLLGCHSSTEFVGWYNGHPDFADRAFDLSATTAVVVGNGNVALDVARMLTLPSEALAQTDVADHALAALAGSAVREIIVLGRRGPAQASFTTPELTELSELADVIVDPSDLGLNGASPDAIEEADVQVKNKLDVLQRYAAAEPRGRGRRIRLRFFAAPLEIVGADRVEAVRVARTELVEDPDGSLRPRVTEREETIPCQLVFRSVGYRGLPLSGVSFDERSATIPNDRGRVLDRASGTLRPGEYVSGWIKRGPSGIIGTNKKDSQETVNALLMDVANGRVLTPTGADADSILSVLADRCPDLITVARWQAIDAHERALGEPLGRPRVKLTRVEHLLEAARTALTVE